MTTKSKHEHVDWYALWMQQSHDFFDSAQENLQHLFKSERTIKPEEHLEEINAWLDNLKKQWGSMQLAEQQKMYANYWKMLTTMCIEGTDLMLKEWIKRSHSDNPIMSIRELYEVWLNCCQEIYKQTMHTKAYQDTYGDLMNAAFHYWTSFIPKQDK